MKKKTNNWGRCGNCAKSIKSKGSLTCHALPAQYRDDSFGAWPRVRSVDVCAHYQQRGLGRDVTRIERTS